MAMPKEEFSRREQYYAAIAGRNGVKPDFPFSREEEYLEAIDEYLDTKADLVNGKVPASQLPSYVDDVLEFQDIEHFPATGELGKIYVALDTNKTYRWSGTTYIQVGGGGGPEIVELSDFSGTFSDSDFEKVSGDNCIILVNTHYFYKQSSAIAAIVYAAPPRLAGQSGNQSIFFDTITIQKFTKEYELKSNSYPA